ncbi:MAG: hypothetical protein ABIN25_13420 [Ginsengibacter sp.]
MVKYILGLAFISLTFISCKKENDNFSSATAADYYPLQVGKYITYDMDSTVYYINFGSAASSIHYQAQDRVEAQITDNLGRNAYRVQRYLRKDSLQAWIPSNTFMVVPTETSVELVENNLRFLKIEIPIRQDFSWKGNSYLTPMAYDTYDFGSDFTADWDYVYDSVNMPLTINSFNFDSTIKVSERDEFLGEDPSLPGTQYGERTYAVEKYAAGVGLIFKEFLHWEYQGVNKAYKGFGVRLSIIDHN